MNIIADENIPFVRDAFSALGPVRTINGRSVCAADVADADILLVRSVTHVDPALLGDSRVRFVGSATIGVDHIDQDYLHRRGIGFANAPACNAESAADYVVSALMVLEMRHGFSISGKRVGIVGHGNVGSRVASRLAALGVEPVINDPPQADEVPRPGIEYRSLEAASECDIVTLHVPLTREGPHATEHLVGAEFLDALNPGAVLINASRGPVIDGQALKSVLRRRPDLRVVLDVWEGEPEIDIELLDQVQIGTAHIAGYSLDGKLRGTRMIYQAACAHLGIDPVWQGTDLPLEGPAELDFEADLPDADILRSAVTSVYDVRRDDAALRRIAGMDVSERGPYFDHLRRTYQPRREYSVFGVALPGGRPELRQAMSALGFRLTRQTDAENAPGLPRRAMIRRR